MVTKNTLEFIPFKNTSIYYNFEIKYEKVNFSEVNPSDTFFHFFFLELDSKTLLISTLQNCSTLFPPNLLKHSSEIRSLSSMKLSSEDQRAFYTLSNT